MQLVSIEKFAKSMTMSSAHAHLVELREITDGAERRR
jgi:hypothetical protein